MSTWQDGGSADGRLIRVDQVAAQPWRNSGGLTRELLVWPSPQQWRVRVSAAEVAADGPFSVFEDTQRWFVVFEGEGVELTIDGTPRQVRRGDAPLCFSGEAATSCRLLAGPTRDLNLMLRTARGGMLCVDEAVVWRPEAAQCGLFARVAGRCVAAGRSFDMPSASLLWFEQAPDALLFFAAQPGAESPGWWLAATPREFGR